MFAMLVRLGFVPHAALDGARLLVCLRQSIGARGLAVAGVGARGGAHA